MPIGTVFNRDICRHSTCSPTNVDRDQGHGNDFFWGGDKNVDMPSDCQNLGGHRHIHPLETKSSGGGQLPPLAPPPAPAPLIGIMTVLYMAD